MTPLLSPKTSGKRPGKQIRKGLRLRGSKRFRDADKSCSGFARSLETAGYDRFRVLPMPEVAARPLRPAFCCFPHASPVFQTEAGKQKTAPKDRSKPLISLRKFGAGEGIRTLDPNLGKVVRFHAESPCFRKETPSPDSSVPGFPPSRMTPGARLLALTWAYRMTIATVFQPPSAISAPRSRFAA